MERQNVLDSHVSPLQLHMLANVEYQRLLNSTNSNSGDASKKSFKMGARPLSLWNMII